MWKDGFIYNNVSFLVINELHFPLVHHSQMCRTDLKEKDVEEDVLVFDFVEENQRGFCDHFFDWQPIQFL